MEDHNCQRVREVLLTELGCDRALRLRLDDALRHVGECAGCRSAVEEFESLGGVLRSPASGDGGPTGGWSAFEDRLEAGVRRAAAERRGATENGPDAIRRVRHVARRWLGPAGAVAAALVVGIGGFALERAHQRSGGPSSDAAGSQMVAGTPPVAPPSPQDVAARMRAFAEVDRVFDGRAKWLLLSGGDPELGLNPSPAADRPASADAGRREDLMLVRLKMLRRGQTVSSADVVIVAGGTATVRLNGTGGPSVRYRLTRPADGGAERVSLRAQIGADGREPEAALATEVALVPGRVVSAGQLVTPAGNYDLRVSLASAPAPAMAQPERAPERRL
jgi:hypothetical protein